MDHSKVNRSLQIQGKATLINLKNHRRKFLARVKKLGLYTSLGKIVGDSLQESGITKESKKELVEKFPDRVLWGTDWPHPNMKSHVPDDGIHPPH